MKKVIEDVELFKKLINKTDLANIESKEEAMHLILDEKVAENINQINQSQLSAGQKISDDVARVAGSWKFIIIFMIVLVIWIIINSIALSHAVDPYPFILLNLILSCIAALQAPIIMMSQNRQDAKDRLRSENDYKIDLKTELIMEDLHKKIDILIINQVEIKRDIAKLFRDSKRV